MPSARRRRLGIALIVVGLLIIVVAVITVLEIANGPGTGPKSFAEQRSYNQVKVAVQQSFPIALVVGLGGLGLAMLGKRLMGDGVEGSPEQPDERPLDGG